jgi:hypothetical protein
MKLAIAAALAAFSLAGSAFADTTVTATLSAPAAQSKFIAAHAVWNCAGATCTAAIAPDDTASVTGCQDLAKKIGHVAAFTSDTKTLDSKGLEKCNKSAAAPSPIGTASR